MNWLVSKDWNLDHLAEWILLCLQRGAYNQANDHRGEIE